MDVLPEILSTRETHVRLDVDPPAHVNINLALLALACLWSRIGDRLLNCPSVVNGQHFGAFHHGPHFVDRGHDDVFFAAGKSGWEVEVDDFRDADIAIGAESRGWIVGRVERDVKDCERFVVVDDGS